MLSEQDDLKYYENILEQRFRTKILSKFDNKIPENINELLQEFINEEMEELIKPVRNCQNDENADVRMYRTEAYGQRCVRLGAFVNSMQTKLKEMANKAYRDETMGEIEKIFNKKEISDEEER